MNQILIAVVILTMIHEVHSWVNAPRKITRISSSQLNVKFGKNYTPKWKKLETLADKEGTAAPKDIGLEGTVSVVFKQGDKTIQTVANPGEPIRDVASQAGQFIKYGCGKGECKTCQALCNGKYITPCTDVVPGDIASGEDYVIQIKAIKSKKSNSGKFYSVRSFFMGFYNNILGMIGFVKDRRLAKRNYNERIEYEAMIAKKAAAKKAARDAEMKE